MWTHPVAMAGGNVSDDATIQSPYSGHPVAFEGYPVTFAQGETPGLYVIS